VALALAATRSGSPYETLLGAAFASLHAHVRCAHLAPLRAEGTIDVEHGAGWLTPVMVWMMTLPAAGAAQPVRLEVADEGADLVWMRRIGDAILRTRQRANGARLEERCGWGCVSFDLSAEDGALVYRQSSIRFAGVPIPARLRPCVGAVVSATADGWHVAVTVTCRGRLVCRYAGEIHRS
jgi:hypothetical protein